VNRKDPFVGSRAKPLKKCDEQEKNIYTKRAFSFNKNYLMKMLFLKYK